LEKVERVLRRNHVEYTLLHVSAPFHTPYMEKPHKATFLLGNQSGQMPAISVYLNALKRVVQSYDDVIEGLTLGLTNLSTGWKPKST